MCCLHSGSSGWRTAAAVTVPNSAQMSDASRHVALALGVMARSTPPHTSRWGWSCRRGSQAKALCLWLQENWILSHPHSGDRHGGIIDLFVFLLGRQPAEGQESSVLNVAGQWALLTPEE